MSVSRPAPWRAATLPTPDQVDRRLRQMLAADSAQTGDAGRTARLMLMLTRSCELRCAYCFVALDEAHHGTEHPGHPSAPADPPAGPVPGPPPGLPTGDMSPATARRAIDLWMSSPKPRLGLQLFGGEPTRRWDTLLVALDHALGHPARAGRELELQLTTNGLGLTPERCDALVARGVVVQLSVDGIGPDNRFRRPHLVDEARHAALHTVAGTLSGRGVRWFLNVTVPPSAAGEVEARYRSAVALGAPGLQLNYATGMRWTEAQVEAWLRGLRATLLHDHLSPGALQLYNWHNAADPAPLCGDAIVDVDGTVLQVGGIFHERRFPALRPAYVHGHLDDLRDVRQARASLADLWARTRAALSPDDAAIFLQGMRLGAAQDLVCRAVVAETVNSGGAGPR